MADGRRRRSRPVAIERQSFPCPIRRTIESAHSATATANVRRGAGSAAPWRTGGGGGAGPCRSKGRGLPVLSVGSFKRYHRRRRRRTSDVAPALRRHVGRAAAAEPARADRAALVLMSSLSDLVRIERVRGASGSPCAVLASGELCAGRGPAMNVRMHFVGTSIESAGRGARRMAEHVRRVGGLPWGPRRTCERVAWFAR